MLDVKDFGAAGDGATSDTYALRRALAAGGEISGVTVENLRFRGNGAGYFFAEKNGEINGVTLKNCALDVAPVPKMHGNDFDE